MKVKVGEVRKAKEYRATCTQCVYQTAWVETENLAEAGGVNHQMTTALFNGMPNHTWKVEEREHEVSEVYF